MNSKQLMKLGNETDNQTDPLCLHSAELEKLGNETVETPQKEYEVYNKTSGQDMGVWEGATPQEAIEAMIAEGDPGALVASYEDWECLEVLVQPQDTSYPTRRDVLVDTLVKEEVEDTSLFWDCLIDSLVNQGIDPEVWLNQHANLQIAELCRQEIYSYLED